MGWALSLSPLQIDGFEDGVGRRRKRRGVCFPGSKSNSFVIHCVAGTSRREDGWMAEEGAGYRECSPTESVFAALHAECLRCQICIFILGSEFNFNFGRPIRGIRAVEGAIGDLRPLTVLPVCHSASAMHTYAPPISSQWGNLCLSVVCIQ